jgi:hypothetical protein
VPSRCGETHRKQNTILAGSRAALPSSTPTCCFSLSPSAEKIFARASRSDYCHCHCHCHARTLALVPPFTHPTRLALHDLQQRRPLSRITVTLGKTPRQQRAAAIHPFTQQHSALIITLATASATPGRALSKQPRQASASQPARTHARTHARATQEHTGDGYPTLIDPQLLSSVRHPVIVGPRKSKGFSIFAVQPEPEPAASVCLSPRLSAFPSVKARLSRISLCLTAHQPLRTARQSTCSRTC